MSPWRTEWTKWIRLCLAGVLYDWQAYPDQTKAVKGQDRKTLVTTGAIKRPLPCPVDGVEKQSIFYNVKRKREQEEKKKR